MKPHVTSTGEQAQLKIPHNIYQEYFHTIIKKDPGEPTHVLISSLLTHNHLGSNFIDECDFFGPSLCRLFPKLDHCPTPFSEIPACVCVVYRFERYIPSGFTPPSLTSFF